MNPSTIESQRQGIIDKYGEWTNHNIRLADGVDTIGDKIVPSGVKVRRFLQLVADLAGTPSLDGLRVLDLACLEGLYGIEMALHGAEVVGIEGREANIEKARFVKQVLHLDKVEFYQDDVRNLCRETYGEFDLVLCLGIFYHLDAPDLFDFAANMAAVCRHWLLLDTHVAKVAQKRYHYNDREYWGSIYREDTTLWSSIGNPESLWLTRPSLYNLLADVGFTSACECHLPLVPKYEIMRANDEADRATFVAMKGQPVTLKTTPLENDRPRDRWIDRF